MGLDQFPVWRIVRIMKKEWNEFGLYLRWKWRCASSSSFSSLAHWLRNVVQGGLVLTVVFTVFFKCI